MPHLAVQITAWGPVINVLVSVSAPRASALQTANQPIPAAIVAKLVVDTGASQTAIDTTILTQLGLVPTGTVPIHTPSTNGVCYQANLYDVGIMIPGAANVMAHILTALPVIDANFKAQGIDGLLGRDVLATSRFTYSGPDSWLLMSF